MTPSTKETQAMDEVGEAAARAWLVPVDGAEASESGRSLRDVRLKSVLRWDARNRMFRICRLLWQRGHVGYGGGGYSAKLSLAVRLWPLFSFSREYFGWTLTLFGIRIHHLKACGGIIQ